MSPDLDPEKKIIPSVIPKPSTTTNFFHVSNFAIEKNKKGQRKITNAASAFGSPSVPTERKLSFCGKKKRAIPSISKRQRKTHQGIFLSVIFEDKKENSNNSQNKNIPCVRNTFPKKERDVLKNNKSIIVTAKNPI